MTKTMNAPPLPPPRRVLLDDDTDDEERTKKRHKPPRPSTHGIRQSTNLLRGSRSRRRSSARFLQLSQTTPHDDDDEDDEPRDDSQNDDASNDLQELYKKAIRMNAENKINASNSWSLRLIENIDNFLEDVEEENEEEDEVELEEQQRENEKTPPSRRVNFTKASCSLDASVKIYSYRVDDVHLTSYKVLANLHRSSTRTNAASAQTQQEQQDDDEAPRQEATRRANTVTLEHNLGRYSMIVCTSLCCVTNCVFHVTKICMCVMIPDQIFFLNDTLSV
jgi:condensin complex subunit 2